MDSALATEEQSSVARFGSGLGAQILVVVAKSRRNAMLPLYGVFILP